MKRARSYWAIAPYQGEIRDSDLAQPGPGQVLIRTLFSGVSRGSEALVASGSIPKSEHQRMRCPFQDGDFPFPVKYGYCNVGEVVGGDGELIGKKVFCLFPHQDYYIVPKTAVLSLPAKLPAKRAVLAANMETALNGLWDSGAHAGDRIQVIGAGAVGLLAAHLATRLPGSETLISDISQERLEIARGLGLAIGEHQEADCVIHCSGSESGLVRALEIAGEEATIVELSWQGSKMVGLPLGGAFFSRRLTLKSSQVGQLPPERRHRWSTRRRLKKALQLLEDDRFDQLISKECAFEQLPELIPALARGKSQAVCQLVRYD